MTYNLLKTFAFSIHWLLRWKVFEVISRNTGYRSNNLYKSLFLRNTAAHQHYGLLKQTDKFQINFGDLNRAQSLAQAAKTLEGHQQHQQVSVYLPWCAAFNQSAEPLAWRLQLLRQSTVPQCGAAALTHNTSMYL